MSLHDKIVNTAADYLAREGINKRVVINYANGQNISVQDAICEIVFNNANEIDGIKNTNLAYEAQYYISDYVDVSDSDIKSELSNAGTIGRREKEGYIEWLNDQGYDIDDEDIAEIESANTGNDVLNLINTNAVVRETIGQFIIDSVVLDSYVYGSICENPDFWAEVYDKL